MKRPTIPRYLTMKIGITELIMNNDPRWYGLPHSTFRPSQFDAIQKIIKLHESGGGIMFLDSPTGTGKSGIATALGVLDQVTVFTSTLELLTQYEKIYGFTAIRGRQWYPCVYPKKLKAWNGPYKPTAFDCHFAKMQDCPSADQCPYLMAKYAAIGARRTVATYRYGSMSSSFTKRGGFLVFDECDTSVREITAHAEMNVTKEEMERFDYPEVPNIPSGIVQKRDELIDWLYQCLLQLPEENATLFDMAASSDIERKRKKLDKTMEALESGDWFIDTTEGNVKLKPLTANKLVQKCYTGKQTIILMSATLGNPEALAHQLGIDDYSHIEYPHSTPISSRPVYAISGSPKMTYTEMGMNDPKYTAQGILIWRFISSNIPDNWRGIILTSSKAKADKLHAILSPRLNRRKIITGKSSDLIAQFKSDKSDNIIAIGYTQGWSHGVDLVGDLGRFSIIASVPYPSDTDPYIKALRMYDKEFYEYNTFSSIPQGIGRVTRGEYSNGEWLLNIGALADARAWGERALKYYPQWFKDSIKE